MRSSLQDAKSLRSVWGQINGAGSITHPGSGDWSLSMPGTGQYVIRISPAFKSPPVVIGAANALALFYLVVFQVDLIQINMYQVSTAGTLMNAGFTFKAEGR